MSEWMPAARHCSGAAWCFAVTPRKIIMEYMLLLYSDPAGFAALGPAQLGEAMAAYGAYNEALQKAGVMRSSSRLRPAAMSTTVRLQAGKTEVLNGPYAETREQLGGYFLIDVPDLDAALSWAARCPGASHGVVEVRPIWPMGAD
jgi:hypothetical protein